MKIIDYREPIDAEDIKKPAFLSHFYKNEKILFFDIETTGFSARDTTLYLIGVLWYEDDSLKIRQWFNDSGKEETDLLAAFENFCKNFTLLVHFNGLGFDLPYLKQKSALLHTDFTADTCLYQLDILKEIRSYKKILGLANMKQVSIEQYLETRRTDNMDGGELIHVYQRYVARPDTEKENLLLLHNHDDLLGMPQITKILNYTAFFSKLSAVDISIEDTSYDETNNKFQIVFRYPDYSELPKRIPISANGCYLNACGRKATLQIPVIKGTLKHYFPDYNNYYYLPEEDMAIHKSIATYVEKEHRIRATKNTCYTKMTDAFVPCFTKENQVTFQFDSTDKQCYQCMNTLLSDDIMQLADYVIQCLHTFI